MEDGEVPVECAGCTPVGGAHVLGSWRLVSLWDPPAEAPGLTCYHCAECLAEIPFPRGALPHSCGECGRRGGGRRGGGWTLARWVEGRAPQRGTTSGNTWTGTDGDRLLAFDVDAERYAAARGLAQVLSREGLPPDIPARGRAEPLADARNLLAAGSAASTDVWAGALVGLSRWLKPRLHSREDTTAARVAVALSVEVTPGRREAWTASFDVSDNQFRYVTTESAKALGERLGEEAARHVRAAVLAGVRERLALALHLLDTTMDRGGAVRTLRTLMEELANWVEGREWPGSCDKAAGGGAGE